MKELVLSTIPDNFSFDKYLPIGTWCFTKNQDFPDWEVFDFPEDPCHSETDWIEIEKDCELLIQRYFPFVCSFLNKQNNIKRSDQFWWVMAGHWLTSLFISFATRNRVITQTNKKFSHQLLKVKTFSIEDHFSFYTSNQLIYNGINDPLFNEWMFSEIINNRKDLPWTIVKTTKNSSQISKTFHLPKKSTKYKILLFIEEFLRFKRVYGTTLFQQAILSLPLLFKKERQASSSFLPKKDHHRYFLDSTLDSLNWEKIITQTAPRSLLEVQKINSHFLFHKKGHLVLCGTLLYSNEDYKVKLANFVDKGGSYDTVQHGCNYGHALVHASLKFIESWRTRFITWGWKEHLDYQLITIPLPSPLIQSLINKYCHLSKENKSQNIYYIARDPNPFIYWLYPYTQPKALLKYFNQKIFFLENLSAELRQKVLYRPAPPVASSSLSDLKQVLKKFPNLKIHNEGNIHRKLFTSKLIVCDTPGTTFHICMGANIPTIGVWEFADYPTVPQTQELIHEIKNANIIFNSHSSAAQFINKNYDHLEDWWLSEKTQKARKNWCQRNALTEKNWFSKWFSYLREKY